MNAYLRKMYLATKSAEENSQGNRSIEAAPIKE
jgi:hypothetical protein